MKIISVYDLPENCDCILQPEFNSKIFKNLSEEYFLFTDDSFVSKIKNDFNLDDVDILSITDFLDNKYYDLYCECFGISVSYEECFSETVAKIGKLISDNNFAFSSWDIEVDKILKEIIISKVSKKFQQNILKDVEKLKEENLKIDILKTSMKKIIKQIK